jgi:hypothetical protein
LKAGDYVDGNVGSIAVLPWDGTSFGQATVVVPSTHNVEYHLYPSWSPDSRWIVFATSGFPGHSPSAQANLYLTTPILNFAMSYDQDTARLRLVSAAGGTPIELAAATHLMNKTSTWPKFAPFLQANPAGQADSLAFLTFSSKFDYGFVVTGGAIPQLWMAGLDLAKAQAGGGDPSYPPFWLPFQDPTEANHSGIWSGKLVCDGDGDCPQGYVCRDHACVPAPIM